MPFDADRFERAKFAPRTRVLDVESLAAFFGEGEAPTWTVRGLTSNELHAAMEASARQRGIEAVVQAISKGGDQSQAVREALGLSTKTPGEIAKRLEMLVMGSVCPVIALPLAVKLAEAFPIEFLTLTNAISELTGQGADVIKPAAASQPTTT